MKEGEGRFVTVRDVVGRCGHDHRRSVTLSHDDLNTVTGWQRDEWNSNGDGTKS